MKLLRKTTDFSDIFDQITEMKELETELLNEEKNEDICELYWLYEECHYKLELLETVSELKDVKAHYEKALYEILLKIKSLEDSKSYFKTYFKEYLIIKKEIRIILKLISSLSSCSNWESPSLDDFGFIQEERDTYSRRGGSQSVRDYQKLVNEKLYEIDLISNVQQGLVTNSGMKALELALFIAKELGAKNERSVYIQRNFYYEGILLARTVFPQLKEISSNQLYDLTEFDNKVGCLILDPGTTWPIGDGIDLNNFFRKLELREDKKPLVVIIDTTLIAHFQNVVKEYRRKIPKNVVICCVESALKYMQYGMDLANMGHLHIYSSLLRLERYRNWIEELQYILTSIPDQGVINRLPRPNKHLLDRRMERIARNSNLYSVFLEKLKELNVIESCWDSFPKGIEIKGSKLSWKGSLRYLQVPLQNQLCYNELSEKIQNEKPNDLPLTQGGSFGFDCTRISTVEDPNSKNSGLRISIGKEPLGLTLDTISYLVEKLKIGGIYHEND